jgi:hypothetical protein
VLTKPGELFIGIRGVCPEDNEIWATTLVKYKIEKGTPAGHDTSLEPTPGVYQQILARLERIESGQIQSPGNGQNGATFIPSVSDEGVISWTNDQELPNPNPVNIKGKDGQPGKDGVTPVKGVDYFTPDEVQEIAEQAAGMVEVPESGGSGGNADFGIEGAEVGQTIVVKAVDENGVPTEWKTVPLSSGLQKDNLVASVVYNSNLEVAVSGIDYATNTFTAVGHGLSENDMIYATLNWSCSSGRGPETYLPTGMKYATRYYAVGVTTNTFQISEAKGGAVVSVSDRTTGDISRWHFERDTDQYGSSIFVENFEKLVNYAVRIVGKTLSNAKFSAGINADADAYLYSEVVDGFGLIRNFIGDSTSDGHGNILFFSETKVRYDYEYGRYFVERDGVSSKNIDGSTYSVKTKSLKSTAMSVKCQPGWPTYIRFWNCSPANGTVVEVYKL